MLLFQIQFNFDIQIQIQNQTYKTKHRPAQINDVQLQKQTDI